MHYYWHIVQSKHNHDSEDWMEAMDRVGLKHVSPKWME